MEIIRPGTKDQVECGGCGALLRFTSSDIRLRHAPLAIGHDEIETMPEPEDHYRAEVECPQCHKAVPVRATRALKHGLLAVKRASDLAC